MELQFSSFTIILCFIIFIFTVLQLGKRSKPNTKLPPGPWKLPLIGNLHQLIGSQPHIALTDLAKKYGGLMSLQLGEISTIIVSSREYAEEVMKTHDIVFASRPKLSAAKSITYNFSNIALSPYGEYWRQLRKICVIELLSTKRVQSLRPMKEIEVSKFMKWVYSKSGSPINLTEKLVSSSYDQTSRIIFGQRAERTNELISIIKESIRLVNSFNVAYVFPSKKLLHLFSGLSSELERVNEKGSKILGDIIDQHIKAKAESKIPKREDEEDLVDVLLKFHGSEDLFTLTIDNIKAIIQDIFGGGSDTSSMTVDWAMTEMIKHPRVMEKVQAEVRQLGIGDDATRISELKYLKLVIKETLRLHPVGPLIIRENSTESCIIKGYEIPIRTRLLVNVWAIGRDVEFWGVDADKFYPERFVDNPIDYKGGNFDYIPFGAGRRMCPGMAFALADVELVLSRLLYYFDWKLPVGMTPEELDMNGVFGGTLRRRDDLYLIPTPNDNYPLPVSTP